MRKLTKLQRAITREQIKKYTFLFAHKDFFLVLNRSNFIILAMSELKKNYPYIIISQLSRNVKTTVTIQLKKICFIVKNLSIFCIMLPQFSVVGTQDTLLFIISLITLNFYNQNKNQYKTLKCHKSLARRYLYKINTYIYIFLILYLPPTFYTIYTSIHT